MLGNPFFLFKWGFNGVKGGQASEGNDPIPRCLCNHRSRRTHIWRICQLGSNTNTILLMRCGVPTWMTRVPSDLPKYRKKMPNCITKDEVNSRWNPDTSYCYVHEIARNKIKEAKSYRQYFK